MENKEKITVKNTKNRVRLIRWALNNITATEIEGIRNLLYYRADKDFNLNEKEITNLAVTIFYIKKIQSGEKINEDSVPAELAEEGD